MMSTVSVRPALAAAALALLAAIAPVPVAAQTGTTTPPQPPPDPGIGIKLLEAPENRRNDPRARRYIIDHVGPGASFSRNIEVTNGTDRQAVIAMYAAAATLQGGEFTPASGRTENELSRWMKVEPATLNIPPGGAAQAKVTITVPRDVAPGERYAVALAELPPPPGAGLVGLASRVGIRVYLSVGPGSEPTTDFELETFKPINEGGRPGITIHSCNTGGRAIDLSGTVKLEDGPGGISAGPFKSTGSSTVAPGKCEDLKILLNPELPRGPWKATAALISGVKEKTASAEITFPEPGQVAKAVDAEPKGTRDAPVVAAAAVGSFLAVAALAWRLLRKRRRPASATSAS